MSTLVLAEHQADILASLRRLKGRGTVGDVVTDSGLASNDVRAGLKTLLESHRGHLDVSDAGELLYEFDPDLIERGTEPFLARAKSALSSVITKGFKAWIVVMLVVYFAVFVALVIAALLAQRGSDSRGGGWSRGRGGHRGGMPNLWFWYWIWGPRWHIGRPYYGQRWERTLDKGDKVPFYKKVFAFVFGPDRPQATQTQLDRAKLRLIRARNGVITTAELVEHTGTTFAKAEEEMGRLLGAYDGEAAVSPDGELVYAFPSVMSTAHDRARTRAPNPAWLRLEHPQELTGNTAGANAAVAAMNTFTFTAAATSPWFIFPRLGITGTAADIGLVLVPVVFSALFFAGPLLRMAGVALENRRRATRNVRRVLLGLVYKRSVEEGRPINVDEAHHFVKSRLKGQNVKRAAVESVLHDLAAELDAEVSTDETGVLEFAFPAIRTQLLASETVRNKLRLENRQIGDIVFSSSDTPEEANARELALFDRQLEGVETDLGRYLPGLDRIDFEDDYEVVRFDEELKMRGIKGS